MQSTVIDLDSVISFSMSNEILHCVDNEKDCLYAIYFITKYSNERVKVYFSTKEERDEDYLRLLTYIATLDIMVEDDSK